MPLVLGEPAMVAPTSLMPFIVPLDTPDTVSTPALNALGTKLIAPPATVVIFFAYAPPIPGISNGTDASPIAV